MSKKIPVRSTEDFTYGTGKVGGYIALAVFFSILAFCIVGVLIGHG